MMIPHLVFTSNGLLGESGYTSPKVEMVLYEDCYTRDELLEEFQAFMSGCGYFFNENESIQIIEGGKP